MYHTEIEKKTVATCLRFATSNTFRKQFYGYLLPNGYVRRVSRGIYRDSDDGFTCKVASTIKEASGLIEAGFEYVCGINGLKLFRKRK